MMPCLTSTSTHSISFKKNIRPGVCCVRITRRLSFPFTITVDESTEDVLNWAGMTEDGTLVHKSARLPRVIFVR